MSNPSQQGSETNKTSPSGPDQQSPTSNEEALAALFSICKKVGIAALGRVRSIDRSTGKIMAFLLLGVLLVAFFAPTFGKKRKRSRAGWGGENVIFESSGPVTEEAKAATIRAWQKKLATNSITQLDNVHNVEDMLRKRAYEYASIDLYNVDPLLQKHLQLCIGELNKASRLITEIKTKKSQSRETKNTAVKIGSLLGRAAGDGRNPRGDEAAGALLGVLVGMAIEETENEKIRSSYNPRIKELDDRFKKLDQAEIKIVDQLTKKYSIPFSTSY